MPTYQTGSRVRVAVKRETTTGTIAADSSPIELRKIDSPGLSLERAVIQSQEKLASGITPMGRLGYKSVNGGYNAELSVGGATDSFLEAILRSTWVAATVITEATASLASITTTTSTIVASAGSWLTAGVRVGDIGRLTNHATAANNNLTLRVVAVTASTITVAGTPLTANAVADTAFTFTILKKVATGTTPTRYSYSIEQYFQDIDLAEVFLGCRLVNVRLSFRPGAMASVTYTFIGMDRTPFATGTSPYFTSPSLTTGLGLIADDSAIRMNGSEIVSFSGFDIDFAINAAGFGVIGSFVTPDVFDNDLTVSGTITALRSDFANLTLYDAETEFELSILLREPESEPQDCIGIFLPRVKISSLPSPTIGGDGPSVVNLGIMAAAKATTTGYDASVANFYSSAA
jgi:hypothetical protein